MPTRRGSPGQQNLAGQGAVERQPRLRLGSLRAPAHRRELASVGQVDHERARGHDLPSVGEDQRQHPLEVGLAADRARDLRERLEPADAPCQVTVGPRQLVGVKRQVALCVLPLGDVLPQAVREPADDEAGDKERRSPGDVAERVDVHIVDHAPRRHERERERRGDQPRPRPELDRQHRDRHDVEVGEQRVGIVDREPRGERDREQHDCRRDDRRAPPRRGARRRRRPQAFDHAALGGLEFDLLGPAGGGAHRWMTPCSSA